MATTQGSSSTTPEPLGHIVLTPGTCGGKPRIDGTRVRVQDVVGWFLRANQSVDEILIHFPQLTRSDVYAALTYYYDHQTAIDSDMEADRAFAEELRAKQPSLMDKIRRKLDEHPELREKLRGLDRDGPLQ